MPLPAVIEAEIDLKLLVFWPDLQSKQGDYKTECENVDCRYWQGVKTHSEIPYGVEVTADQADVVADGHSVAWCDFAPGVANLSQAQLEMQEYRGEEGDGFVLIVTFKDLLTGNVHQRRLHQGPEEGRAMAWTNLGLE